MTDAVYVLLCLCWSFSVNLALTTDSMDDYTGAIVTFNYTLSGELKTLGSKSSIEEVGKFGNHSPLKISSGYVFHSLDPSTDITDGCIHSYTNVPDSVPWIALISRGHCNFANKINNAKKKNASGVIIYGFKDDRNSFVMSHEEAKQIVALNIEYSLGSSVAELVNNGTSVYVTITPGEFHPGNRNSRLERTSIIFVSISFMILMLVSLAWLVFYYIQRFRLMQSHNRGLRRRNIQMMKAISKLPVQMLKRSDPMLRSEEICAICLDNYKAGETIEDLPCKHQFHKRCVDPWLEKKYTCPMCKINVLKALGMEPYDNPALTTDIEQLAIEDLEARVEFPQQRILSDTTINTEENLEQPHFSGSSELQDVPAGAEMKV